MSATPVCEKCGCRLARHSLSRGQSVCWPCGGGSYPTHLAWIDAENTISRGVTSGSECARGHDLAEHGVVVNTGGGRTSRKCGACRALATQRRAARARAATQQRQQAQTEMTL